MNAFAQLNEARSILKKGKSTAIPDELIWQANQDILWHEQTRVVQPLFDRLSGLFSYAMTFFASFDYRINHQQTGWRFPPRFFIFMIFNGFTTIRKTGSFIPQLTNLEHRWYWIVNDILKKWRLAELSGDLINEEIEYLAFGA